MGNIRTLYDKGLCDAFLRAREFCQNERLSRIETIFLVKEFFCEKDCKLYDYFQNLWENIYITTALDATISEVASNMRKEKKSRSLQKSVTFPINFNGKREKFSVSMDIAYVIGLIRTDEISKISTDDKADKENVQIKITIDLFCEYLIQYLPSDFVKFLRRIDTQIGDLKDFLSSDEDDDESKCAIETAKVVPFSMESFLTDITDSIQENSTEIILGRDKESEKVWNIISKRTKRNAILVGEPGVGKTAIVYKLATDIKNGKCPEQFKDFNILSLDITGIIAGTTYRGQAEERFNQLKDFLETNSKIILFIDEIHTMLGAGNCREGELDLANSLKPVLARDKAIVIGATTCEEYEKYFSKDAAIKRRFEKVEVNEPKSEEIYPMLENQIKDLEKYHSVRVEKEIVDFIIFTASCFNYETRNPDRTLDLIDRSMVVAKNAGKKEVDKESVLKNYDVCFEIFEGMSVKEKTATAYHEAGHYIMHRFSEYLIDMHTVALSIMPTETYLGVNVLEDSNKVPSRTLEYYIDEMASKLAGRVAEKMYTATKTAGASSDLNSATKIAYKVITEYALVPGYNFAFFNKELKSDEEINRINKSIEDLLEKAEKRAEEVLKEHEDLLKTLVEELLEKQMLSKKDLDRICENHNKV